MWRSVWRKGVVNKVSSLPEVIHKGGSQESGPSLLRPIFWLLLVHPRKLTWNPRMDPSNRRFLLGTTIFRFYVKFRGSISFFCNLKFWSVFTPYTVLILMISINLTCSIYLLHSWITKRFIMFTDLLRLLCMDNLPEFKRKHVIWHGETLFTTLLKHQNIDHVNWFFAAGLHG